MAYESFRPTLLPPNPPIEVSGELFTKLMNAAQIATAKRIHINLVFHRRLQITEQVSLIHAVLEHFFKTFCSISFRCGGLSIERNQKPLTPEITPERNAPW